MEPLYDLDKIKVRISRFVYMITYNDAVTFGFRNKNGDPNINGFLNKLLPTLFDRRRARSMALFDEIIATCEGVNRDDIGKIQDIVDRVVDKVYFPDAELGSLLAEIWIRPTKKNQLVFMEMASEAPLADYSFSTYLRSLLNEYCKLPQYKREHLVFDREFQAFFDAMDREEEISILVNGKKINGFPINYVVGFADDQKTYLFLYDLDRQVIRSILLRDVQSVIVTNIIGSIPDYVHQRMQEIYSKNFFLEENTFPVTPKEENT